MSVRGILALVGVLSVPLFTCASTARAEITIETVGIGNLGNPADTYGRGGVDYYYKIGTFEVTAGQYTEFFNAVAATDAHGLYSTQMWETEYGYPCKIQRSGSEGSYSYSVAAEWANRPVNYVSWGDAARFCNWLHNGQPTGAQDLSTTEDGSYYLNGATTHEQLLTVVRKEDATWVLPVRDEWWKAARHYNDGATGNYWRYATQSDTRPTAEAPPGTDMTLGSANYYVDEYVDPTHGMTEVGAYDAKPSVSAYGTFDQVGNVNEWLEEADSGYRDFMGGSYQEDWENGGGISGNVGLSFVGFRVVEITDWVPPPPPPPLGIPAVSDWGLAVMILVGFSAVAAVATKRRHTNVRE